MFISHVYVEYKLMRRCTFVRGVACYICQWLILEIIHVNVDIVIISQSSAGAAICTSRWLDAASPLLSAFPLSLFLSLSLSRNVKVAIMGQTQRDSSPFYFQLLLAHSHLRLGNVSSFLSAVSVSDFSKSGETLCQQKAHELTHVLFSHIVPSSLFLLTLYFCRTFIYHYKAIN